MRIFKTKWFSKYAKKAHIRDAELKEAAGQDENFIDLGGNVYKLRFASEGKGKSGGYRFILFFKQGDKLFYEYAYAKSDRGNISQKELRQHKAKAKIALTLSSEQIDLQKKQGDLVELSEE